MCGACNKTEAIKAVHVVGSITPLLPVREAAGPGGPVVSPQVWSQHTARQETQHCRLPAPAWPQAGGLLFLWVSHGTGFPGPRPQPTPPACGGSPEVPAAPHLGPGLFSGSQQGLLASPSRVLPSSWFLCTSPASVHREALTPWQACN